MPADLATAVVRTPGTCGGRARLADTRIPAWLLVLQSKLGKSDAAILANYPDLAPAQLDAAWDYYAANPLEIERDIWDCDTAMNVPEGRAVPSEVIVAGKLLGLGDDHIRDALNLEPRHASRGAEADALATHTRVPREDRKEVGRPRRTR